MATIFTTFPETGVGSVFLDQFTFNLAASLQQTNSYTSFAWDFGDGTYYYGGQTANKIYNYPGTYKVSLSAWKSDGSYVGDHSFVEVDYPIPNKVVVSKIPGTFSDPGRLTTEPFVVSLTSTEIHKPITLTLQALNTNSIPLETVPDKWRFITPTWHFVDASTNKVVEGPVLVNTTPITAINFNNDIKTVAVKGEAAFYYCDDIGTRYDYPDNSPVLITATLSTAVFTYPPESNHYPYNSFSNSEAAKAAVVWQVNDYFPTNLKVTENFINPIYAYKWTGIPIPVMINCEFRSDLNKNYANYQVHSTTVNLLGYPRTNDIGANFPVTISLSSSKQVIPRDYYTIGEPSLFFTSNDELNNNTTGYLFTTITPLSPIPAIDKTPHVFIDVSTQSIDSLARQSVKSPDQFAFPSGYPIYANAYISHINAGKLNVVNLINYPMDNPNIKYYSDLGVLSDGSLSTIDIPILKYRDNFSNNFYGTNGIELSGTSAVYAVAFDPILNRLYTADADQDYLHIYNSRAELLSSVSLSALMDAHFGTPSEQLSAISLSALSLDQYNAPSYISIDQDHNLWVSLYGKQAVYKFDSNLTFLLSCIPTIPNYAVDYLREGTPLISPPVVETDLYGDAWVCYSHESYSKLVKYKANGAEYIDVSEIEPYSNPVALAIDCRNSVWVACYNIGEVRCYSSEGSLKHSIKNISQPSYIAVDRYNNVWFTHGHNYCSKYEQKTKKLTSWQFFTKEKKVYQSFESTAIDKKKPRENEIWGGLSVDVYNRVWLIDSDTNKVIVFPSENPESFRIVRALPVVNTNHVLNVSNEEQYDFETTGVRSAQAAGDWTGNRWYQKYASAQYSADLKGSSTNFVVQNLENTYQIAKVNEEFDVADYYKTLALPEPMKQYTKFFDEFMGAVVGNGDITTGESVGRVAYERIANFVQTHADVETVEVNQLLSLADAVDVKASTFGNDFPNEVNRLINLFSVPKHRLRGSFDYSADLRTNIGPVLYPSSFVTSEEYLFAEDKHQMSYQLVYISPLINADGTITLTYPLSSLEADAGLKTPLLDNYNFFRYREDIVWEKVGVQIKQTSLVTPDTFVFLESLEDSSYSYRQVPRKDNTTTPYTLSTWIDYEPKLQGYKIYQYDGNPNKNVNYKNNIINWKSDYTTIDYTLSSYKDWYGNNGIIELMFNNLLTKRLFDPIIKQIEIPVTALYFKIKDLLYKTNYIYDSKLSHIATRTPTPTSTTPTPTFTTPTPTLTNTPTYTVIVTAAANISTTNTPTTTLITPTPTSTTPTPTLTTPTATPKLTPTPTLTTPSPTPTPSPTLTTTYTSTIATPTSTASPTPTVFMPTFTPPGGFTPTPTTTSTNTNTQTQTNTPPTPSPTTTQTQTQTNSSNFEFVNRRFFN